MAQSALRPPSPGSIFHTYDIRGIYPAQIDAREVCLISLAAARYARSRKVVLGHDARLSSPLLFEAAKEFLVEHGFDVIDIGVSSTDLYYFSVEHFRADLGIMVTASHNPSRYNGLKIVGRHAIPIAWGSGLERIERIYESLASHSHHSGTHHRAGSPKRKGKIIAADAIKEFAAFCRSFVDMGLLERELADWKRRTGAPLRVILDAGDGLATMLAPQVLKGVGIEPVLLFFDIDGNFPGQGPNPLDLSRMGHLRGAITSKRADLGVTWDADTDRVIFFDERSSFVAPDAMLAIIAGHLLAHKRAYPAFSGDVVVCDVIASRFVEDEVHAHGGRILRTPIGQASIKPAMLKSKGLIGGECSGHMTFRAGKFCTDNGYIPVLLALAVMAKTRKSLSQLAKPSRAYFRSPEINIAFKDSRSMAQAIDFIERHYGRLCPVRMNRLDGITVEFPSWWCNVRKSNTEPLLRLRIEADSARGLRQRTIEVRALLSGRAPQVKRIGSAVQGRLSNSGRHSNRGGSA